MLVCIRTHWSRPSFFFCLVWTRISGVKGAEQTKRRTRPGSRWTVGLGENTFWTVGTFCKVSGSRDRIKQQKEEKWEKLLFHMGGEECLSEDGRKTWKTENILWTQWSTWDTMRQTSNTAHTHSVRFNMAPQYFTFNHDVQNSKEIDLIPVILSWIWNMPVLRFTDGM